MPDYETIKATLSPLFSTLSPVIQWLISAVLGGKIALWLADRNENREAETTFNNRLRSVACELPLNFRNVGNHQNPFQTRALETIVLDEPRIHKHPVLFQKAHLCLYTALILSSSSQTKLRPGNGQSLMKELAEFISDSYDIRAYDEDQVALEEQST